jgi:hypothetical protein
MKTNGYKSTKAPAFVLRAERAPRRAQCQNPEPRDETSGDCLAGRQGGGEIGMRDVRKYATEQGIAEEEALKNGMEEICGKRRGGLQRRCEQTRQPNG